MIRQKPGKLARGIKLLGHSSLTSEAYQSAAFSGAVAVEEFR